MVSDRMVLTEKLLGDWYKDVEYVGSSHLFSVMSSFKGGAVLWYNSPSNQERKVLSVATISDDDYYGKFLIRQEMLGGAGIKHLSDDSKRFIILCSEIDLRPKAVKRGSDTWDSTNVEGALIAWSIEACKSVAEIFSQFPSRKEGAPYHIAPPLQTKRILSERDRRLGKLYKEMGLELIGYMSRCPDDWHMIQQL
jgi:hypothetical protein